MTQRYSHMERRQHRTSNDWRELREQAERERDAETDERHRRYLDQLVADFDRRAESAQHREDQARRKAEEADTLSPRELAARVQRY